MDKIFKYIAIFYPSFSIIRYFNNYFSYNFSGSSNEFYRKYAKAANDLANMLTHKRNATKRDMLITISATLSLVNLIGVMEGKYE